MILWGCPIFKLEDAMSIIEVTLCFTTALIFWGVLELSVFQFVELPTKLCYLVAHCHYERTRRWFIPSYLACWFFLGGIFFLSENHDSMQGMGLVCIGMSFLIPFLEWYGRKLNLTE
jgi:hypothetical protein